RAGIAAADCVVGGAGLDVYPGKGVADIQGPCRVGANIVVLHNVAGRSVTLDLNSISIARYDIAHAACSPDEVAGCSIDDYAEDCTASRNGLAVRAKPDEIAFEVVAASHRNCRAAVVDGSIIPRVVVRIVGALRAGFRRAADDRASVIDEAV